MKILSNEKGNISLFLLGTMFAFMLLLPLFQVSANFLFVSVIEHRVDDALYASATSVFAYPDMDKLAVRNNIGDKHSRNIYFDDVQARNVFEKMLKKNLRINDDWTVPDRHYLEQDVSLVEFEIFEPNELPGTCSQGATFNRTTIHVVLRLKLKRLGSNEIYTINYHRDFDGDTNG